MKHFFLSSLFIVLLLSSCRQGKTEAPQPTETTEQAQPTGITAEMAYEGVNNYCHPPSEGLGEVVCPNKEGSLREKSFKNLIQNLTKCFCSTDIYKHEFP